MDSVSLTYFEENLKKKICFAIFQEGIQLRQVVLFLYNALFDFNYYCYILSTKVKSTREHFAF